MPIRILKKDKNKSEPKKRFDPRTGEETNKPGGKDPRTIYRPDAKEDIKPTEMRTGGLSPKQKAIASKAPPPNKITGADFAVLKKEKAKGRGMGLQDEKIKPGKVMKAKTGKMTPIKKDPTTPVNPFEKRRKQLGGGRSKLPGRIGTALGIGAMMVPAAYAAAKQYKDYKSAKNRDKAKVKKYSKGGDLRLDYIDRQTRLNEKATGKKDYIAESKKTRREEYGAAKDRYPNKTDKLRGIAKNVGRALTPSFAAAKSVYDKLSKSSAEKYSKGGGADTGKIGEIKSKLSVAMDRASRRSRDKDRLTTRDKEEAINIIRRRSRNEDRITNRDMESASSAIKGYKSGGKTKKLKDDYFKVLGVFPTVKKKMGGGMMQRPMGYKSGTMVKARGCKLGRSKPTKMY